ncbi:MAG: C_GCAxxG_C_C family protein [Candidatus Aminicenantes bacterium]|nr:C_GCAxxG_C_C family protein [Candidatus Aminicenantes bacterium]
MYRVVNEACSTFKEGFSCSQAVFSALGESFGLDRDTALKISQPFGGGIAYMGETCGAVTGAFMVIGLQYGRTKAEDSEAKAKTYATVHEFVKRFKAEHHSIVCREILGYDVSDKTDFKMALENKVFETVCPLLVRTAAEICVELLPEFKNTEP